MTTIFSIPTCITHSVIPHPNFAFVNNLVYVKFGGQAECVLGDSEIKASQQNVGSWLVVVKSAINPQIFATYENQPHNNTLSWFPHQYLVKGCCNGESDFSPVLIILITSLTHLRQHMILM